MTRISARATWLGVLAITALAARGSELSGTPLEWARLYASGQRSQALARLDGWQGEDFRREWVRLRDLRNARRGSLPDGEMRAAMMLHTDRAALDWERLSRAQREESCADSPHRDHALSLATYLMAQPDVSPEYDRNRAFVQRWLTAMALDAHRYGCFSAVPTWTQQGAKWFPQDAVFLLIQATAVESTARLRPQPPLETPDQRRSHRRQAERAEWRERLVGATRDLEAALLQDPGLDEARLRLGRLQWQLDQKRNARETLEALLARAQGLAERYLGHLFLGRVEEAAGDQAAALVHYREALRLEPESQAAAIAVAHALHVEGDADGSRDVLRTALAHAPRDQPRDPWLSYNFGRTARLDGLLEALRAEVSE